MSENIAPWFVLTGGPSAGKTTVLQEIAKRGYKTVSEAARTYIEERLAGGETYEQIRGDEGEFQKAIVEMKIRIENGLSKSDIIFFDRGIHDSAAYYELIGLPEDRTLTEAMKSAKYRKVFLLELLPYVKDGVRKESPEEARKLNELLRKHYESNDMVLVDVPVLPVAERTQFVLDRCDIFSK